MAKSDKSSTKSDKSTTKARAVDVSSVPSPAPTPAQEARVERQEQKDAAENKKAARTVTGPPAPAPPTTRIEAPLETEAQLAAGPHRPEPARQVRHDPPSVTETRPKRGTANIKVRATQDGFYGEVRRRAGDVFVIEDEAHFSKKWMERVSSATPEKYTTSQEVINQRHDEILASRAPGGRPTADTNVIGDD